MAQQVSTAMACRLAEKVRSVYPWVTTPSGASPDIDSFYAFGLPKSRAHCCVSILQRSAEVRRRVREGQSWDDALADIKGIGPWTLSVFRIMVLRDPDVLPIRDVGLERAVANIYGNHQRVERLGETWRPFRSVACWYLWKTLGNEQLG
jgi:DNA-3-methyladenine glycosylase II